MSKGRIEIRNSEDFINALSERIKELKEENEELRKQLEALEEVKRGTDILRDLCPTCFYCSYYEAEISSEGYVRTTKCIKRGKVKGVLNECDDYKKE